MFRRLASAASVLLLCAGSAMAASPDLIIRADQVPDYLKQKPVILVATHGPGEVPPGYLEGAFEVNELSWTAVSGTQDQMEDYPAWSKLIGATGIDGKRPVLIYDDGELKFASRIRYLLAHYGVPTALLVNGGWKALAGEKLKTQPRASLPVIVPFVAHPVQDPIPIATRREVQDDYRSKDVMLIDVRTPEEFNGTKVLKPGERAGHIPGAKNLPIEKLFEESHSNELARKIFLAAIFELRGVHRDKALIFYCQDGARSSLGALAAKEAGFPNVKLYYLSFLDWQSDPKDPVEK